MLRPDEIVIEPVSLLPCQSKHLLSPGGKIVHRFVAHKVWVKMRWMISFVQTSSRSASKGRGEDGSHGANARGAYLRAADRALPQRAFPSSSFADEPAA